VIVVFGNERAVRLSHVAAFTDVATSEIAANRTASLMIFTFMLSSRRDVLRGVARLTSAARGFGWHMVATSGPEHNVFRCRPAGPSPVKSGATRPDLA